MSEIPPMLTLDAGLSDGKAIWRVSPFRSELLKMAPEVTAVTREKIDFYKSRRMTAPEPEDEAWVEYKGTIYAVGSLAHKYCNAWLVMGEPKYEWAVAKVLAAVGVMAQKEGLPDEFALALALPLPYGEWEDRRRLERDVREALANFSFCDRPMAVQLKLLLCIPEGGGHVMAIAERLGRTFNELKILSLMWGYRDISFVLFDRGIISGHTEPLGFYKYIELVVNRVSGYTSRDRRRLLLETIHQVGRDIKSKNFKRLSTSRNHERIAEDAEQMAEVVRLCRAEYWEMSSKLFRGNTPQDINAIVLGGGGVDYYRLDLRNFYAQDFAGVNVSWFADLEEDVRMTFNLSERDKALCARLTDPFAVSIALRNQVCPRGAAVGS